MGLEVHELTHAQRAEAIAQNLSLGQIRIRVQTSKESQAPSPQVQFAERYAQIGKRLQRINVWQNTAKQERLNQLLAELEQLVENVE